LSSAARRPRPGRPRHIPEVDSNLSPRDQILDACARLFTQYGYAATSTRDIADAVGIRQASLYYHFAGKPEILEELLARTVRPTLDQIDRVDALAEEHGPSSALYALVMIDTQTLADAPHNAGRLPSLPEVLSLEESKPYRLIYHDLVTAYARLGSQVARLEVDGVLLEHLVSVVVTWRVNGDQVNDATCHMVAKTVLRSCGATHDEIKRASAVAWSELIEPIEPTGPVE
jgi:AcrR family transcriptional regulator